MATPKRIRATASSGHPFAGRMPFFIWVLFACLSVAQAGCSKDNSSQSGVVLAVDDFGDTLRMSEAPRRIVSLTPASTELLFSLGAGSRLVGRTRWDIWPDSARLIPDLGDGIRPNVEAVIAAKPDLVLLYGSLENRGAAQRLRSAGVRTLSLKVDLPAEFRNLAEILGRVLHDTATARAVVDSVDGALASVREITRNAPRTRIVWIADVEPLIVIGGGSFLTELMSIAGGTNVFADIAAPSAPVSLESVITRDPEIVLGSQSLIDRLRNSGSLRPTAAARNGRLVASDPYSMGRPSVRMGDAARQLAQILHPGLFK